MSKLLKSVFLEGREVLIAILLAICFTWHEPSSLEDRGVLWNLGSAWGCGGSRCRDLGGTGVMLVREGSSLLFPALEAAEVDACDSLGT